MSIRERLMEFGKRYGFIPRTKEVLQDDFSYVDPRLREVAHKVKTEIDVYYVNKEGARPFHWHNVKIYLKDLHCRLEYAIKEGKRVLKGIKGHLGGYLPGEGVIFINRYLPEMIDNEYLKYTVKHELFHSLQDELGMIRNRRLEEIEGEASMFAVDDFEKVDFKNTERSFSYRPWTLRYIWERGKKLMTSFRERFRKVYDYFTEEELEQI